MKSEIEQLIEKMLVTDDAKEIEKIRQEINRKLLATDKFKLVHHFLHWNEMVNSYAYTQQRNLSFPLDEQNLFNLLDLVDD